MDGGFVGSVAGENSCNENVSCAGSNQTVQSEYLLLRWDALLIILSIFPLNCSKNPAELKVLHHYYTNFTHTEFSQLGRSQICAAALDASIK